MAQLIDTRRRTARPYVAAKGALSLSVASAPVSPPSEEVVAAVLMFADVNEERDDGFVTRRLSAARLAREDMALVLSDPRERERAMDVSVIWDEAEGEIVRVIDLAPLRAARDSADQVNRYAAARMRGHAGIERRAA